MNDSNDNDKSYYFQASRYAGFRFALGSILLVSLAQLLIKYSTITITTFDSSILYNSEFFISLFIAGCVYLVSIFLWIKALSHLPLSIAYQLLSLSYPIVYIAASSLSVFDESFNIQRIVGVSLIVLGVILGSRK
jgi:undecaprenyl phosphate-alpha-L-ara4N flippase subunit ArnF